MRYTHDLIENKLIRQFNVARHVELTAGLLFFISVPFLMLYSLLWLQLIVTAVVIVVCFIARRCWQHFERQLYDHYASRLTFTEIRWMADGIVKRDVH